MNLATTSAAAPLLLSNLTATSSTNFLTLVPNVTTGGGGIVGPPPPPPLPPPIIGVVPPPFEAEAPPVVGVVPPPFEVLEKEPDETEGDGSDGGESGGPPPFPPELEQEKKDEPIALPYLYDPEPQEALPPLEEEGKIPGSVIPPEPEPVTGTATAPPWASGDPDPPAPSPETTADPDNSDVAPDIGGFYFDPESSTTSPEGGDGGGDGNSSLPESPDIGGFYFDPNPTNDSAVGPSFGFLPEPELEGPTEEDPEATLGDDRDGLGPDPELPASDAPPFGNDGEDEEGFDEQEEDRYQFDPEPGELTRTPIGGGGGGGGGGGSSKQNTTNATTATEEGPIEMGEAIYYDPDPPIEASRLERQPTSLSAYYSKHRTLAIIPHITGAMSMLGSGWIILDIARDRKKHGKVYHRLMLSMSVFDFMSSFWLMLSTIPVPAGSTFIYGARGTTATCTAQGFFLQLNIATPLYNMYLSIYYLLLIGYQWCEGRIKRQVEPKMHVAALVFALGTAVAGIVLKLYNPTLWCHIAAHPMNCNQSYRNGGESDCIRGDNASVYMFAFYYGVLWFAIIVATVSLFLVYWKVLSLERRTEKYQFHGSANSSKPSPKKKETRKKSLTVANLSLLYMLAFYLTWIFPTIAAIMYSKDGGQSFVVSLLAVIFLPLQGFFNVLIYVRPRYQQYRKKYAESSVFRVLGRVVRRTVSFTFWNSSEEDDGDHELGTGVDSSSQSQSQPAVSDSEGGGSSDASEGEKVNKRRPENEADSPNEKVEVLLAKNRIFARFLQCEQGKG